jgi:hypothetical protein
MFRSPDVRAAALLLGLSLALWLPRLRGSIDLRYDGGFYYILGTSLAQGKGYRLLNEPGDAQAVQYPPLLPAFVALHQWALGTADPAVVGPWLRRSYCLVFVLYVLAVYALARQYLSAAPACLVAAITALYFHTYFLSDLLFAEVPFALATVLFALCHRRPERPASFALTALLGVTAYLLRTAGIALLAAWVAEGLCRKRWKQAALRAAVALLPLAAWQAYISHVTSGFEYRHPAYPYQRAPYLHYNVSYAESVRRVAEWSPDRGGASAGDVARRFVHNLAGMPPTLGEGVTTGRGFLQLLVAGAQGRLGVSLLPPWVVAIPLTALGCLTLAGAALLARREYLIPLYVTASIGLICLTPWSGEFLRYLAPLTPFLALCLLHLLVSFHEYCLLRWPGRWRQVGSVALALTVAVALGTELLAALHVYKLRQQRGHVYAGPWGGCAERLFYYDRAWADYDAALAWLKGQARPGEVVATSAPERVYLYTGLKAVMPPLEVDPAQAQRLLDAVPVTYVIVDDLGFADVTRRYTGPTIRRHPGLWQPVYQVPGSNTHVYRRVGRVGVKEQRQAGRQRRAAPAVVRRAAQAEEEQEQQRGRK